MSRMTRLLLVACLAVAAFSFAIPLAAQAPEQSVAPADRPPAESTPPDASTQPPDASTQTAESTPPDASTQPPDAVPPSVVANGETPPALTLAGVEAALEELESDASLDDAVKSLLRPKYKQLIETLKQAEEFAAKAAAYREALQTAPDLANQLRTQLEGMASLEDASKVTATGSIEDLQKEIDSRRAALNAQRERSSGIAAEIAAVMTRPVEISGRLPQAQRELADIRSRLDSTVDAKDATAAAGITDRMLLQAAELRLMNESEMLNQEQLSQSVREDLLQARQDLLTREIENASAALESLQALVRQRLSSEAKRVSLLADMTPQDLPPGDEAAKELLVEVQTLAKEFEAVVNNLREVSAAQDDITARRVRLDAEYESIREQLDLGGGGRVMAQVLVDLRNRLRDARAHASVAVPLDKTRLAAIQVGQKLRQQGDVENRFADVPSNAVARLVAARGEILTNLKAQYGTLIRSSAALDGDKRQYRNTIDEVRDDISDELFWMRSSDPLSFSTFTEIPAGLKWVFSWEHWTELGRAVLSIPARLPWMSASMILVLATLLLRRQIRRALERTGARIRRISTDRYARTSEALLWTTLLALPIPLAIGYVREGLAQVPEPSDWLEGVAIGLPFAAWLTFVTSFLIAVCRKDGLGPVHFGWGQEPLNRTRSLLRRYTLVYVPAILLTCSTLYGSASDYFDSVGRVSFMLAQIGTAIFLAQLLHPSEGILGPFLLERPHGIVARWRYLWYGMMIAFPIVLTALSAIGYGFTALRLSADLLVTLCLVAIGVILYELALRWFMMNERKIALAAAIEKRRARRAAENQSPEQSGETLSLENVEEEELDLDAISSQTRHLLRVLFTLGVAAAIVLLLSNSVPLIAAFQTTPVPLISGMTVLGLLQAVLIVVVTWVMVQNLPGLLELAVLRQTSMEPGTRTAVSTLCQYAVIAIGISLLFSVLKLDWSKLGWIAAALSVGLGFGLQEVVANFVCGLILLFERPIRVGDVVTLEGMTGTVTRVQMRATTITNWDRQEFVVPNKNLITGTLLNWTLSASTNRIVIPVGVAYGSDTERARQILLEVAADNPQVLDEPPPIASFEEFAASSLTLRLRAFIPNLDHRLGTISELHAEIDKRFAAAGIEIAFPQLDLHVRSQDKATVNEESWKAR